MVNFVNLKKIGNLDKKLEIWKKYCIFGGKHLKGYEDMKKFEKFRNLENLGKIWGKIVNLENIWKFGSNFEI